MTTVLGVDPGSRVTGYGVLQIGHERRCHYVASGCIRTTDQQMGPRLVTIYEALVEIIRRHRPQMAAIEQVFVHRNVAAALKLGQARGVALLALSQADMAVATYAPRAVKEAVTGYGNADKKQVQAMMQRLLHLSCAPSSDAADALAIAFCHTTHWMWEQGLKLCAQ